MKTTKEFLDKLTKINFNKISERENFEGDGFTLSFYDKIDSHGATIRIVLKYEGVMIQSWGAWNEEAIETAEWREKLKAKIQRSEMQLEAIKEALGKDKFNKL